MKKEILKIVGASALSIGLLSAAFIGGNEVVFVHAASQTLILPNVTAELPPQGNYRATEGRDRFLQVNEIIRHPSGRISDAPTRGRNVPVRSDDTISPRDAAQLGAQYLYDIFGVDIDGREVEMFYVVNYFGARNYWQGTVAASDDHDFIFKVDTISGRRVSMRRAISGVIGGVHVDVDVIPFVPPADLYRFDELARGFAENHFNLTEVVSVKFELGFPGRSINTVTTTGPRMQFIAIDNTGREAIIWLCAETGNLISICSMSSDVVPGFVSPYLVPIPGAPGQYRVLEPDECANAVSRQLQQEADEWAAYMADREAIRQDPNHPRFMEMFGRVWNDPTHPRFEEWFGHMSRD